MTTIDDIRSLRSMADDGSSDFGSEKLRRIAGQVAEVKIVERSSVAARLAAMRRLSSHGVLSFEATEARRLSDLRDAIAALCDDAPAPERAAGSKA